MSMTWVCCAHTTRDQKRMIDILQKIVDVHLTLACSPQAALPRKSRRSTCCKTQALAQGDKVVNLLRSSSVSQSGYGLVGCLVESFCRISDV